MHFDCDIIAWQRDMFREYIETMLEPAKDKAKGVDIKARKNAKLLIKEIKEMENESDSDSDSDSDVDQIPSWDNGSTFKESIKHQCLNMPDVDSIFIKVNTIDLCEVFAVSGKMETKRLQKRDSEDWDFREKE